MRRTGNVGFDRWVEQRLLDEKAEKLFDSLTSYSDSPADRKAALALVRETYPTAKPVISTFGIV